MSFSLLAKLERYRKGGEREGGEKREGREREGGAGGECFCVVSRNIVLWMQCLQWCCHCVCVCVCVCVCLCAHVCVCLFSPLYVFGLTCPQG